jgi:zinc D-Ala-D-Ala carboxypeptidase
VTPAHRAPSRISRRTALGVAAVATVSAFSAVAGVRQWHRGVPPDDPDVGRAAAPTTTGRRPATAGAQPAATPSPVPIGGGPVPARRGRAMLGAYLDLKGLTFAQSRALRRRQLGRDERIVHVPAVAVNLAAERIQTQARNLPHRRPVVCAPAVECSETEHEFSEFERLGQVVVGAESESGGLVVEPVGSSKHQDRHAAAGGHDALGDLITRGPGDISIEHGDVVGVYAQHFQSGVTVIGNIGRDCFQAQPIANGFGHVGLVLDNQHTHDLDATSRGISSAYGKPNTGWQHNPPLTRSMSQSPSARTASRGTLRPTVVGLVVLTAAVIGPLIYQSASSSAPSLSEILRGDQRATAAETDGGLPSGVSVFDDHYPGVANLDSDLLRALRAAATDAADGGVEFSVNSGWRSPQYQTQLRREAVPKYGSEKEAARWVATADTSAHVSGEAIDIGLSDAQAWLSQHGAKYGLCQIYSNEPWHYELRPEAIDRGCPPMYADPAHDPRMRQ